MFRKEFVFSLIFIILLFAAVTYLLAQDCKQDHQKISRSVENYTAQYSYFNINNISTIIYNDGRADIALTGNSGFEYPKGSGKTAVYQSGLLWGGKVNNHIRAGGSRYRTGLQPGRAFPGGSSENLNSESVRVYRVRPDYLTADLSTESSIENKTITEVFDQYEKDWKEWPAVWGAPFEDVNDDGNYNWEIDIPGVPGADQTLWLVANDIDSVQAKFVLGSPSMGIEMQVTIWGYKSDSPLDNVIFKKYKLINKSNYSFEEMYLGMWTDHDIGDAGNDFAGCDTTINL
ncbi:hypothetical protein ACFLR4_05070, partial [Bacteroidota bacterium]